MLRYEINTRLALGVFYAIRVPDLAYLYQLPG